MIDENNAVITAVYSINDNIQEMKNKLDKLEEKLNRSITDNALQTKDIELTKEEIKLIKKEMEIVKERLKTLEESKDKRNSAIVSFISRHFGKIILSIASTALLTGLAYLLTKGKIVIGN